ncbi:ribosomal RNA large subunit methyltransferase J [Crassisporium funariophilum]|nr:ribosomal RNA large subunit methyltransferase J [Crassisporium funariophilum]
MVFRQTLVNLSQKSRSKSSSWVARQYRDPYVKQRLSDPAGYRARSAFKLLEIDERWNNFLAHEDVRAVVDLGAAPGGWSQVVAGKLGWNPAPLELPYLSGNTLKNEGASVEESEPIWSDNVIAAPQRFSKKKKTVATQATEELDAYDPLNIDDHDRPGMEGRGTIIAVDLLNISPIPGVQTVRADFMLQGTEKLIHGLLCATDNRGGKADVILSDMAGNVSGNDAHDTQSSLEICEAVYDFTSRHLRTAESIGRRRGGVLSLKFFAHPLLDKFREEKLKPNFNYVSYIKPDSSRSASKEGYFLCQGWNP